MTNVIQFRTKAQIEKDKQRVEALVKCLENQVLSKLSNLENDFYGDYCPDSVLTKAQDITLRFFGCQQLVKNTNQETIKHLKKTILDLWK